MCFSENDFALLTQNNFHHLLQSSKVAEEIADELDLYGDNPFEEQNNPPVIQADLDRIIQEKNEAIRKVENPLKIQF